MTEPPTRSTVQAGRDRARPIGDPHLHLAETASTNLLAREHAVAGAPHGAVISADLQTAGRGRQGRPWSAVPGALAVSVVLRDDVDALLPLRAGLAVARLAGPAARIKWPNDVLVEGRKIAGILAEREGAAVVLGIGVNAAIDLADLPPEVAARAGSLGRDRAALPALRLQLLRELEYALALPPAAVLAALAARDALVGQAVRWAGGEGVATGIGADGCLLVQTPAGEQRLDGGEVHLL